MRNFYEHILFILEKYLDDKYSNTEITLVQRHIIRFLASENHVTSCYIMLHHAISRHIMVMTLFSSLDSGVDSDLRPHVRVV